MQRIKSFIVNSFMGEDMARYRLLLSGFILAALLSQLIPGKLDYLLLIILSSVLVPVHEALHVLFARILGFSVKRIVFSGGMLGLVIRGVGWGRYCAVLLSPQLLTGIMAFLGFVVGIKEFIVMSLIHVALSYGDLSKLARILVS